MNNFFHKIYFYTSILLTSCFINLLFSNDKLSFSANNLETINNDLENKRIFKNNVSITKEGLYMFSDLAIHYPDSSKIFLNGNVRMYGEYDSLFCNELILYDQDLRKFDAKGNINFFKNKQKIESDKLKYTTIDSANNIFVEIINNVAIYDSLRIVKGDTLLISYQDTLINNFVIKNNAQIFNSRYAKIDSSSKQQVFDDIFESKKITINFIDNLVKYIEMDGMSTTKLYAIKDTIVNGLNILSGDSILVYFSNETIDSLQVIGGARGDFHPEKSNVDITTNLKYKADKITYNMLNEESFLIDNAHVEYDQTLLDAGEIYANWESNILEARIRDGIYPAVSGFSDNPTYGDLLIYDLVKKEGKVIKGETEYGSGNNKMYYNGEKIFRNDNLIYHISNSVLTSCDYDKPHYYFKSKKMKMIPNEHIYAKPMTLYIHDLPILTLPFAIFPNKQGKRTSGWIMPSFGNNDRGTYMDDLGFYYAPNDYFDNLIYLDVFDRDGIEYSNKFRYKHNSGEKWYQSLEGSIFYKKYTRFDIDKVDYKDIFHLFSEGKYIEDEDILFSHTQKFTPLNSLRIDYQRFSDTNFEKISLKEKLSQKNTTNINYTRHFPNNTYLTLGYNFNDDMLLSQPTDSNATSTYSSTTGPELSYAIPLRNLFKNTNNEKWYENIKFNYSLNYSTGSKSYTKESCIDRDRDGVCDQIETAGEVSCIDDNDDGECDYILTSCTDDNQDGLCDECEDDNGDGICDNCIDDNEDGECDENYNWSNDEVYMKNYGGLQNNLTLYVPSPFSLINITPTFNLKYDITNHYDICDDVNQDYYCDNSTINSIEDKYIDRLSWNSSLKFSTDIYGIFPINIFNVNAFRHQITPSLTFNYKPKGGQSFQDINQFYYSHADSSITDILNNTNAHKLSTNGENSIDISIKNEFMAKRKNETIYLFNYNLNTSFNNNRVQKFNPLVADLRINKPNGDKIIDIDFTYDMYDNQNNLYLNKGKMPKLKTVNFNIGYTFNLDGTSAQYTGELDEGIESVINNEVNTSLNMFDLDEYKPEFKNGKLWDSAIRFSAYAQYEDKNWTIESPNMTINGGINLTKDWVLTYSGNYDFDKGTITIPTFNLSRNLHCWDFNFMWRPAGNSKGFRLKINLKNPDLQDIKVRSTSPNFKD